MLVFYQKSSESRRLRKRRSRRWADYDHGFYVAYSSCRRIQS